MIDLCVCKTNRTIIHQAGLSPYECIAAESVTASIIYGESPDNSKKRFCLIFVHFVNQRTI